MVPELRIRDANGKPLRGDGAYVLYWMTANRRPFWNHALQRAVEHARALSRPLLIVEALRCGYPWASDRLHRFVIEGMVANTTAFAKTTARYVPWVETRPGAGKGLLEALARQACVVIGDEFPCFFLPAMISAAATRLAVRFEVVDANGLLPLRATTAAKDRAVDFRRLLQKTLRPHLGQFPVENPLKGTRLPALQGLPAGLVPIDPAALLAGGLAALPIDHQVGAASQRGGWQEGNRTLDEFITRKLTRYAGERSLVESDAASGLSPYLHFGHLSAHQAVAAVWAREGWSPERLATTTTGSKEGWWGLSTDAEAFLDELVTWRELGYHFCHHRPDYAEYQTLPAWALKTLEQHALDPREYIYTREQLAAGETHDPLWNAAQRQLVSEGRMHNYLRMLWGKKVLEWSPHPRIALATMIDLNNRYALDGRDPNSYSGIMWCLGRFDRPWAPMRPVFGSIRYMSSANTARKMRVKEYIAQYGGRAVPAVGAQQTFLEG